MVPWGQKCDRAKRLIMGHCDIATLDDVRLSLKSHRDAREIFDPLWNARHLGVHLFQRPSGHNGFQDSKLGDVLAHHIGKSTQVAGTLYGIKSRPTCESCARSGDCGVNVSGRCIWNGCETFSSGRVGDADDGICFGFLEGSIVIKSSISTGLGESIGDIGHNEDSLFGMPKVLEVA